MPGVVIGRARTLAVLGAATGCFGAAYVGGTLTRGAGATPAAPASAPAKERPSAVLRATSLGPAARLPGLRIPLARPTAKPAPAAARAVLAAAPVRRAAAPVAPRRRVAVAPSTQRPAAQAPARRSPAPAKSAPSGSAPGAEKPAAAPAVTFFDDGG